MLRTKLTNENNLYKPTPENLRGTPGNQLLVAQRKQNTIHETSEPFEPQMDADEYRLTVDLYLFEFVFICGCCRRLHDEAYTLTKFFVERQAGGVEGDGARGRLRLVVKRVL